MKISELSKKSGISTHTLRYYEKLGLMSPSHRSQSNYRVYSQNDMDTAKFIKSSKECGFTLAQIASLLAIKHNKTQHVCEEAKQIAQTKISELEQEIAKLKGIKKTLEELEAYCCGGQESAEFCSILAGLETR